MKQSIMYFLLQQKASQCQAFRDKLTGSKGNKLIEDTGHEFWGRGRSCSGLNMLGRLLETLRENMPQSNENHQAPRAHYRPKHPQYNQYPKRNEMQLKCYNCGEKSHNLNTCRHQSPLRCYSCAGYGHKQKVCWKNSSKDQ